jgi:aspartate-semialdehyde dehydrogenase
MPIQLAKGEAEKSEREPMRLWGTVAGGQIVPAESPMITAQCIRVPVSDGHMAAVFVAFDNKPTREQIIAAWTGFAGKPQQLRLPSAPQPFLHYTDEDGRPQTRLDRDAGGGQAIVVGHLHPDRPGGMFDWRFVGLSHNTVRGAAGGAVLTAELLKAEGWIAAK